MGFFSSAVNFYNELRDRINSTWGSTPPPGMSLNSSGQHFSRPIRIDLDDPGPIEIFDPFIPGNSAAEPSVILDNMKSVVLDNLDLTRPSIVPSSGGNSASSVYSSPLTPAALDYLNADIAKHYGMSRETAYQEAISNTAYQRGVKDMQAAGLNPAVIYGAGKGSPADGVYSVRSNSSGGSGRGYSGSSKSNGKLFSTGEFYGISAAAGLVSAIASKNPNSYWIGQTVAQGVMTAANSFFGK